GELLVEMGSISPHNLEFALELQMQAKLFDVFSWPEGRYQFNTNVRFEVEPVSLSMGPALLLYEGASRSMSTDRIRRDLAVAGEWMLVPSSEASLRHQALQLEPRADRFLDAIDGTRTAEDLIRGGGLPADDAALVLYALVCTSLVRVAFGVPGPVPVPPSSTSVIPVPDAATAAIASDEEETLARVIGGPKGLHIPRREEDDPLPTIEEPSASTLDLIKRAPSDFVVEERVSAANLATPEAEVFDPSDDPFSTMDDAEWAAEIDVALDKSWASSLSPDAVKPSSDLGVPVVDASSDLLGEDVDPYAGATEEAAFAAPTSDALTNDLQLDDDLARFGLPAAEPLPIELLDQTVPEASDFLPEPSDAVIFRIPEIEDWLAAADPLPEELVFQAPVPDVEETGIQFGRSFAVDVLDALYVDAEPLPESVVQEKPDPYAELPEASPPEPIPESMAFEAPVPEFYGPVFSTSGGLSFERSNGARQDRVEEPTAALADETWAEDIEVVFESQVEPTPSPATEASVTPERDLAAALSSPSPERDLAAALSSPAPVPPPEEPPPPQIDASIAEASMLSAVTESRISASSESFEMLARGWSVEEPAPTIEEHDVLDAIDVEEAPPVADSEDLEAALPVSVD
ncbi:MAG: DUF4388 domain-containing protein, partial [Pseudomonadota bacterium]